MTTRNWSSIQESIQKCRVCEENRIPHLRVPFEKKCMPKDAPSFPIQLYFVSVAPPWGGAYFWNETKLDPVREGLFSELKEPLKRTIDNCLQFREFHFFLTPAVKCSSEKEGKDYQPLCLTVRNCSRFLKDDVFAAAPERILALGRIPFQNLCNLFNIKAPKKVPDYRKNTWWVRVGSREIPMSGTYFPGNNRHKGFPAIVEDMDKILKLKPRKA